jgi:hypothetical protein
MPTSISMHRLALLLTLVLCLPLAAHADQASRRAKAAQLVVLLHTERMVQQASADILKQVSDAAENATGPNPTPQNQARLADFEKNISQLIDTQLGWKAMQPAFTDLYAKTFTEQELDVIVAFYKSPAGVALLENMPTIDAQATQLAHSRLDALQPQLNQLFDDFRKSQAPPTPAASPAAAPAPTTSTPK